MSSEADERYLRDIRTDCAGWLGAGAELVDVRRQATHAGVTLVARVRFGNREGESSRVGDSLLAAHSALRAQILIDRIRFGLSAIVQPDT
jgi:hypothetical protein